MSSWSLVTSYVPQWSVTTPILLNIFINEPDDQAESTLNKVADNPTQGMADSPKSCATI